MTCNPLSPVSVPKSYHSRRVQTEYKIFEKMRIFSSQESGTSCALLNCTFFSSLPSVEWELTVAVSNTRLSTERGRISCVGITSAGSIIWFSQPVRYILGALARNAWKRVLLVKTSCSLRKLDIYYRFLKSPSMPLILNKLNPIRNIQ